jgi:5-deoxy-glucuronate isomerase
MANLLIRAEKPHRGYRPVVRPGDQGLEYLGLALVDLGEGDAWDFDTQASEWTVVILSGSIRARTGQRDLTDGPLGSRRSVFDGRASALYLPPGCKGRIESAVPARLAVCQARSDTGAAPTVITPDRVAVRTVGVHNWRRQVHDIVDQRVAAGRLLVGETFNETGGWSSYPPHRHDEHRPPEEVNLEEVYYFQVEPPQGFGLQRVYTDDRRLDECYAVEHGDTVILPRGYHPVAAAPGYRLYYLWLMAGQGREMAPADDPAHHWLKAAETLLREAGGRA